jgi:hypothetical protein
VLTYKYRFGDGLGASDLDLTFLLESDLLAYSLPEWEVFDILYIIVSNVLSNPKSQTPILRYQSSDHFRVGGPRIWSKLADDLTGPTSLSRDFRSTGFHY